MKIGKVRLQPITYQEDVGSMCENIEILVAAWELWERALLPSLLSWAGTWLDKIDKTVKRCNQI